MKVFAILALAAVPSMASAIKRDDIQVLCGQPLGSSNAELPANKYAYPIGELIGAGDAKVHFSKGPGACQNVACNPGDGENAGVSVCSDSDQEVDILKTDMAFFAQQVYNKCKVRKDDGQDYITKGQAFVPDQPWNVILASVGVNKCQE